VYSIAEDVWSALPMECAPSGRGAFRPVWTGTAVFIWGRNGGSQPSKAAGILTMAQCSRCLR